LGQAVEQVAAPDLERAIVAARRRLIRFLFLLYIVAYLGRINVGFASLQMNDALGFSSTTFALGAGIFFLGYALLEIPSNIILTRVGAAAPGCWPPSTSPFR
jgi:sugar phosphate permease